ncbi:hypothetical protein VTN00DRAFT_4405 [Thermoascus crustaceus]|uniref:uncharacterized protein n=1 Tax=Thermoascus crustaceus TaxID=5088 RepID=UPI0037445B90
MENMLSVRHQVQRWVVCQLQNLGIPTGFLEARWPTLNDGTPFPKEWMFWNAASSSQGEGNADDSELRIHNPESGISESGLMSPLLEAQVPTAHQHQRQRTKKLKFGMAVCGVLLGMLLVWFLMTTVVSGAKGSNHLREY